jgi:CheY-like chemotaxis protein
MTAAASAKTILIVEDEPLVREVSVSELQEPGYDVLEAPTALEALAILNSGLAIALVFIDVNMPGNLDGLQLAAQVRERWPQVRLIVTSGGCQVGPEQVRPPGRFIPKPYLLAAVIDAVRELPGEPN